MTLPKIAHITHKLAQYADLPELQLAIITKIQARIDLSLAHSPLNLAKLRLAKRAERILRTKYKFKIAIARARTRLARAHAARYHWQIAQRPRTADAATTLRANRRQIKRQARLAAEQKRADNLATARALAALQRATI